MKVNSQPFSAAADSAKAGAPKKNSNQPSVGDIANQISGNEMTKTGRAIEGKGNPKLDKDAFFKLMLTQVKNQDPMNPLKEHEMAAQLAQFSSLEQMSNIKEVLTDMNKNQVSNTQYQSLDLMGKYISGDSSKIDRAKGDKKHDISFDLADEADVVQISITDPNGNIVKEMELNQQQKGPVKISWDGNDKENKVLPAGNYKVSVQAASNTKGKVNVNTQFKGQVTGVNFTDKGPILMVGSRAIALKDVKTIEMKETAVDKAGQAKRSLGMAMPTSAGTPLSSPMAKGPSSILGEGQNLPIDLAAFDAKNLTTKLK